MVSTAEIASLPVEERLKLLDFIWETLENEPAGPPLTEEQRLDIDARLAEIERHPNDKCSWEEFRRTLPSE